MDQALTHQGIADGRWRESSRPRWAGGAFSLSLVLLGTSYVLLLAAPLVSARLSGFARAADWPSLAHWIPAASGAGLALGGGAALLLVLARLSKDIRQHPYACVAPALAAFSACVLIGLGAKLPLGPSEPLCVFALALSVMGGSLVQESRAGSQILRLVTHAGSDGQPGGCRVGSLGASAVESRHLVVVSHESSVPGHARLELGVDGSLGHGGSRAERCPHASSAVAYAELAPDAAPWNQRPNPFSAREDTLDLDLRSDELALRKRPLGRPMLIAACCVLAGIGVAVWQSSSTQSVHPVQELVSPVATAVPSHRGHARSSAASCSTVEPYVPSVATPEVPSEPTAQAPSPELALAAAAPSAPELPTNVDAREPAVEAPSAPCWPITPSWSRRVSRTLASSAWSGPNIKPS